MEEEKIKTLCELIKANKSFSYALNHNLTPDNNDYITFELIFIYLNANKNILKEYDLSLYEIVCNLFRWSDYYIEGTQLHTNDNTYDISFFINLINSLEAYKKQSIVLPQRIFTDNANTKTPPKAPHECKVYSFNDYRQLSMYEMSERELVFQYTTRVDDITKPYISNTINRFRRFINYVVTNYLNGSLDKISNKELQVLASYLNLFPLFCYGQNLIDFPFERLSIPSNEIGVAKITFDNKEIVDINRKYQRVKDKIEQLSYQEALAVGSEFADSQMLNRVRRRLNALKREEMELLFELFDKTHQDSIYNPTFLKSLWLSFLGNTVDINNYFNNPVLRTFVIKGDVTNFYCAIHLDTLFNLIDNEQLLSIIDSNHKLILKN